MTRVPGLLAGLALDGCAIDQGIVDQPSTSFDSADSPTPSDDSHSTAPIPEECNGVDDDGDGLVDEGFDDTDANGLADCLQTSCALDPARAESVEVDPSTRPWDGPLVTDPWNVDIGWDLAVQDGAFGTWFEATSVPLVLPGGGTGTPAVVTTALAYGRERHDGSVLVADAAGALLAEVDGVVPGQNGASADIDGDGEPELFFQLSDGAVAAMHTDGSQLWRADFASRPVEIYSATVADLTGDGVAAVFFANRAYDAATGAFLFELTDGCGYHPLAIGDIDQDGAQEVALCDALYSSDGELVWRADLDQPAQSWPLLVQADLDPQGEVAFVHARLSVVDTDGTILHESEDVGSEYSIAPPCAADFDGDGAMEIAWPASDTLYAYDLDGRPLWTAAIQDTSTMAGCTASDLDGDGHAEVLYMDEVSFSIFDGGSGAILYRDDTVRSLTAAQSPVVVDLDGDGHTEIVISMGDYYGTASFPLLRVYRHAGDGWTRGSTVWPSSDFSMVNVEEDGTVPRSPEPSWSRYGVFRGQLASGDGHPLAADLAVSIDEVCVEDCLDGPVVLSVQVTNHGSLSIPEGTPLAVYTRDTDAPRAVTHIRLAGLPAGTATEGFLLSLTPDDLRPGGVRIVVDDDGTGVGVVQEVDEGNNAAEWTVSPCG